MFILKYIIGHSCIYFLCSLNIHFNYLWEYCQSAELRCIKSISSKWYKHSFILFETMDMPCARCYCCLIEFLSSACKTRLLVLIKGTKITLDKTRAFVSNLGLDFSYGSGNQRVTCHPVKYPLLPIVSV